MEKIFCQYFVIIQNIWSENKGLHIDWYQISTQFGTFISSSLMHSVSKIILLLVSVYLLAYYNWPAMLPDIIASFLCVLYEKNSLCGREKCPKMSKRRIVWRKCVLLDNYWVLESYSELATLATQNAATLERSGLCWSQTGATQEETVRGRGGFVNFM